MFCILYDYCSFFKKFLIEKYYILGWPTPKLSWWRENALLDDSWEVSSEQHVRTIVSNTLTIEKLQRSDLNARLTCQASNSNISIPISRTVSLDMSCKLFTVFLIYLCVTMELLNNAQVFYKLAVFDNL